MTRRQQAEFAPTTKLTPLPLAGRVGRRKDFEIMRKATNGKAKRQLRVKRMVRRQDPEAMMLTLKYIAASPDQKYGGFHIQTKTTAANALREIRRLQMAVRWALGEVGDFPMRQDGQGVYWWRTELRRRAGMSPNGELSDRTPI